MPDDPGQEPQATTYRWTRISDTTALLIVHLERLLQTGTTSDFIEAATVVAGLASLSNLHIYVMNQAGIPAALVKLIVGCDVAVVQAASKAIFELSRNDEVRSVLRAAGAIQALNQFLLAAVQHYTPAFIQAMYSSLQCLRQLSKDHIGTVAVNSTGGIALYTNILKSSFHSSTTSAAASLIAHLATTASGTAAVASCNSIQPLLKAITSLDPQEQHHCMRSLATMTVTPELHDIILECGGISTFTTLLRHGPDSQVAQLAAKALAHITILPAAKLAAVSTGIPALLTDFLEGPVSPGRHSSIQWAAHCLCNISTEPSGRSAICTAGGVPLLLDVASAPRSPATAAAWKALANLSKASSVRAELFKHSIMVHLVAELQRHDASHQETVDAVLLCLARQVAHTAARKHLAILDGIRHVVQIALATSEARTLFLALDVLSTCGECVDCAAQIVRLGAVKMVMRLLSSMDGISEEILVSCLRLLATLARHAELREEMAEGTLLPTLLQMVQAGGPKQVRSWALQALVELAGNEELALEMAEMQVGLHLGQLLKAGEPVEAVPDLSLQLLDRVVSHPTSCTVLSQEPGLVGCIASALDVCVHDFRVEDAGKLCGVLAALCHNEKFGVQVCSSWPLMGVVEDFLLRPKSGCSPLMRPVLRVLQVLAEVQVTVQLLLLRHQDVLGRVVQQLSAAELAPGVDRDVGRLLKQVAATDSRAREVLVELGAVRECRAHLVGVREPVDDVQELLQLLAGTAGSISSTATDPRK